MFSPYEGSPSGREILAQLAQLTGVTFPASAMEEAALFENRVAQPATVGATLAAWQTLREGLPAPVVVAGYSVGQLAACSCAGALPVSDCLRLAVARAAVMDAACGRQPHGMAVISGAGVNRLKTELSRYHLFLAIEIDAEKAIVAGLRSDLERFADDVGDRIQVTMLPLTVASHTPLMSGATPAFRTVLERTAFVDPTCPVLSGIDGAWIRDAARMRQALCAQLAAPLNWGACMDAIVEAGADCVLELGPGRTMAGMFQARHPSVPCRSVADFRNPDGAREWVARQAP